MKNIITIIAVTLLLFVSCSSNEEDNQINQNLFSGKWKFSQKQADWADVCPGNVFVEFNGNKCKINWYDKNDCTKTESVVNFEFTVDKDNTIINNSTKVNEFGIYGDANLGYQLCFGSNECYNIER